MTDQELKDLVASLSVAQAKTEVLLDMLAANNAAYDARSAVLDARVDKLVANSATYDARSAIYDARVDKMAATVESVGRQLGGIGNNQGDVTEEFFYNSLCAKPEVNGIVFDTVQANVEAGSPKHQAEFDIVLNNGANVAVIEVKYKLHPSDVEHAANNMQRYRDVFPQHKTHKLYGGIAGFSISSEVTQAAKAKGLFVLKRKGDIFTADTKSMVAF